MLIIRWSPTALCYFYKNIHHKIRTVRRLQVATQEKQKGAIQPGAKNLQASKGAVNPNHQYQIIRDYERGGGVLIGKSIGEFFDLFGLIGAGLALDATQMSTKEQNVKGSDTTKAQ
jgi:hypothetical protein